MANIKDFIDPKWTFPEDMKIELAKINKKYFNEYGNDLEKDIKHRKMEEIKNIFISFDYPWEE